MKFIRHKGKGFFIFPVSMAHRDMAAMVCTHPKAELLSAGFVDEKLRCSGRSESLSLASRTDDTLALHTQMGSEP